MKRLLHIAQHIVLVTLLPMLLVLAPARAQLVVRVGDITDLNVDQLPGDTYSWEIYNDSTVNFATATGTAVADGDALFVNGDNTGSVVQVQWLRKGIYFFKVTAWDVTGCTNNLAVGIVKVIPPLPTAKLTTFPICEGDPVKILVELTGTPPWNFTITDGTKSWNFSGVLDSSYDAVIIPGPKTSTSYWVTLVSDPYGVNTKPTDPVPQVVNPKPATSVIYYHGP